MKTIIKVFALISSALLIISCSKEAVEENLQDNNPRVDSKTHILSFGASFEGETKLALGEEDNKVTLTLEGGEQVLVVSGANSYTYVYSSESSKFEPEDEENAAAIGDDIYVYYPAGEFTLSGGNVIFTMPAPAEGAANFGKILPLAGKLTNPGSGYTVQLKSTCAVLKASVKGAQPLSGIGLTQAGDTRTPIAQNTAYTMSWSEGEDSFPTFSTAEAATDDNTSISLGGLSVDVSAGETFYFILPAGSSLGNLTVTVNLSEAHNGGSNTMSLSRSGFTPNRKGYYKLSFYAGLFSGGEGTAEKPFLIANARDFKHISDYCKNGYVDGGTVKKADSTFLSAHYLQTADISFGTATNKGDISAYMIGTESAPFTGKYEGDNKELRYFTITNDEDLTGLWRSSNNAAFSNIHIVGAEVSSTLSGNVAGRVGALVGYAQGSSSSISGCVVTATTVSGLAQQVGGIAGRAAGNMTNCYFGAVGANNESDGSSVTGGSGNTGGIVGFANCNLSGCQNRKATINSGGGASTGGIAGSTRSNVTVVNCRNSGIIDGGESSSYVGGIVAYVVNTATFRDCINTGEVKTSAGQNVGGIIGRIGSNGAFNVTIEGCVNQAAITGKNYTGGIVGYMDLDSGTLTIGKSGSIPTENSGPISGQSAVGGIIGCVEGAATVNEGSYNAANITGSGQNIGGLVGLIEKGSLTINGDCYNGEQITVESTKEASSDTDEGNVGGLVGNIKAGSLTISGNCINYGNVKSSASYAGGIVGETKSGTKVNISECTNNGTVSCTKTTGSNDWTGGIIGYGANAVIVSCTNKGDVTSNKTYAGGIAGQLAAGKIDKCINAGDVNGNGANVNNVGGIVGGSAAVVKRCYSAKGITIEGGTRVGGIVGQLYGETGQVVNCASASYVKGKYTNSGDALGVGCIVGVEGNASNLIANCVALYDVSNTDQWYSLSSGISNNKKYTGGLVGAKVGGLLQNCFCMVPARWIGFVYNENGNKVNGTSTNDQNNVYIGQIVGHNNAGDVKDCYYGGFNGGAGARAYGKMTAGTLTNVTLITSTAKTPFSTTSNIPVAVTTSTSQNFVANNSHLSDILNGGTSGIVGYTLEEDEDLTWSNMSDSNFTPIPKALKELGEDYYNK